MNYLRHLSEHRRISMLILLARLPGYGANDSVLCDAVNRAGVPSTRDQIRGDLAWLAEQGLIEIEPLADLKIARLTERGRDVAEGRAVVDGVKRPSP